MCIQLHGMERTRLVLDPFLGIGNTLVACAELDVSCVGFETDSEYCRQSRQLLEDALETGPSPSEPQRRTS
jgi:site-specific DNA-methyltransferase (adenine-specific)